MSKYQHELHAEFLAGHECLFSGEQVAAALRQLVARLDSPKHQGAASGIYGLFYLNRVKRGGRFGSDWSDRYHSPST